MSAALDVRSLVPVTLDRRCLSLRVDPQEVLRFQGYKKDRDIPDATVLALFDEALALGESLMEPRFVYRSAKVTGQGSEVIQAGGEEKRLKAVNQREIEAYYRWRKKRVDVRRPSDKADWEWSIKDDLVP